MKLIVFVALGGALGSVGRYLVTGLLGRLAGEMLPLGTLAVNVSGSFAAGLLLALLPLGRGEWEAFFVIGFLGGFTTFSAFSVQNLVLLQEGRWLAAFLYIAMSTLFSLAAAGLGFQLGGRLG